MFVRESGRSSATVIAMERCVLTNDHDDTVLRISLFITHNIHAWQPLRRFSGKSPCLALFYLVLQYLLRGHISLKPQPWYLPTTASYGRTSSEDRRLAVSIFLADPAPSFPLLLAGPTCTHLIHSCLSRCSPNRSLLPYFSSR